MLLVFLALAALINEVSSSAAEPPKMNVWPDTAPGEKGDIGDEQLMPPQGERPVDRLGNVTVPTITVYKPSEVKDTGAAVVICPGGGYHILAMDLEGTEVADWLNSIGVTDSACARRSIPARRGRSVVNNGCAVAAF